MHGWVFAAGVLIILIVLWDAFETTVLPRRVSRRFRLTRIFYRTTWSPFRAIARGIRPGNPRENFLSVFGPLSLLLLLATWAFSLILGFALLHWGLGSRLAMPAGISGFRADLYLSGTTFFTLGLGDVAPASGGGRVLTVIEGGMGVGFPAAVHRVPAGPLPGVLAARGDDRSARRAGRLPSHGGRAPPATQLHGRRRGAQRALPGMGALVRGAAREPRLLSGARLLPIPARQPVVGCRFDDHPRRLLSHRGRRRGGTGAGRPARFRDGAPRGRGPRAGLQPDSAAAAIGSPAAERAHAPEADPRGRGNAAQAGRGRRSAPRTSAANVRAVRLRSRRVPADAFARLGSARRREGQLADHAVTS